jgi:hypothetical protein
MGRVMTLTSKPARVDESTIIGSKAPGLADNGELATANTQVSGVRATISLPGAA